MSGTAFPLSPGSTIGILGGGQLGRMMALAAARLGLDCVILTPRDDSPASRVSAHTIVAPYDDPDALAELARRSAVVTYEFENVPAAVTSRLEELGCPVAPGPRALAVAQDRVVEKAFFEEIGAPTVAFTQIDAAEDIAPALQRLGAPALLKTRREGYDGKGQVWIKDASEAGAAFDKIGRKPAILEARASFVRELSVIAARGRDGAVAVYPLGENHHENSILRRTLAPAQVRPETANAARAIAARLLETLDYVGVVGVELFELEGGRLLVNEFAPRVHNTGHWTLDGCEVDQFEQHVRAVAGWPLGPAEALAQVEMLNLLGAEADSWPELAADPSARIWLYGKHETAEGRKMGHVNRLQPLPGPPNRYE